MPTWKQQLKRHAAKARVTLMTAAVLVMATGCVTARLDGARGLIEAHPKGFADAVNASAEAEAFVRAALREVNRLEQLVEGE